jgi:hypothetical protein
MTLRYTSRAIEGDRFVRRSPIRKHAGQYSMRHRFEIGPRTHIVLHRPETLVRRQVALRDVSDDEACPRVIFNDKMGDCGVRRNSQTRDGTFKPTFETTRILDLDLRGGPGEQQDSLLNAAVIFEVLSSSSTEKWKYDGGQRFQHYRTIDSFRDYILIDQGQIRIEQYTRRPDNIWTLRDYQRLEEELSIDSIGVSIPLHRIYDQIEMPPS